ncbi:hypothetical protein FHW69_002725 [Luteibacter sp. Sphag1AF]|uniref:putative mucin/carbohydrate-binding domain-containing protein n=1 Tax=Luteibacter sp. Sphag1AF TaxID=2587031 RepID=UPI0016216C92|nr:putative mucin/carbohydrate-binding domain-containing protein [Luteibacter sp. Sphag1AF]MBB3228090.1 hypothetical protein [Luteibacter sp. Sphag1AF]
MATLTQTKRISTLQRPVWLELAKLGKGVEHDRQSLGIILPVGATLRVRQSNEAFASRLNLRLLNDDSETELSSWVENAWVSVVAQAVSVAFIDTPLVEDPDAVPTVEFEYPDDAIALPTFRAGDDEAAFFAEWDSQDADFALLESAEVIMLLPLIDKENLRSLEGGIAGLFAFFQDVLSFYNELVGLSFEPQRPTDLNIANRFFMKADEHGIGLAYFGNVWTAESSNSMKGFFLTPEADNWGCLHELGHAYQGGFMTNSALAMSEVWNNIYAASYEAVNLGDAKFEDGWLYNYGGQAGVEKKLNDVIASGAPLNQWDLRLKLYFTMLMIDRAGRSAFTWFNQQYRMYCNPPGTPADAPPLVDMLAESFATAGAKVDVAAVMDLGHQPLSPWQRQRNLFSQAQAVYPLNQFFSGDELSRWRQTLKQEGDLSLVSPQQLRATGIKGDVELSLSIDDFSQIYGQTLVCLDGAHVARSVLIEEETISLSQLPIGIYTVRVPTGRNIKYLSGPDYLVVTPGKRAEKITFLPRHGSDVLSQEIRLLGLSDKQFAYVTIDQENHWLVVDVSTETPHLYYPDETYASITVMRKGAVVFSLVIPGTKATLTHTEIPFDFGDVLQIFHDEPKNRLKLVPPFDGVLDGMSKTNVFEITSQGLRNQSLGNDTGQALLPRLEATAAKIRTIPSMLNAKHAAAKDNLLFAIDTYRSPERESLLALYADCLPTDNDVPADTLGNAFSLSCLGISDREFLTAHIDLRTRQITVALSKGVAHGRFPETYVRLFIMDANGKPLLDLDVLGTTDQAAKTWTFPVSGDGGEEIRIYHAEPKNRLVITNEMQNVRLAERSMQQNFRLTPTGLEPLLTDA